MMECVIAVLVVVAAYMGWCFWKGFFYPVCFELGDSENPDEWKIVKITYGDGRVVYKVEGWAWKSVKWILQDGGAIHLYMRLQADHFSMRDVEFLIAECRIVYQLHMKQKNANTVVKREIV